MVDVQSNDVAVIDRAASRLRSTQRYYAEDHIMYLEYALGFAQRQFEEKQAKPCRNDFSLIPARIPQVLGCTTCSPAQ
jgi:hypothetical protein